MATDDSIPLRDYFEREVLSVRRDIAKLYETIAETAAIHAAAHEKEHRMTEQAVAKAEESVAMRLESMNEFRAQLQAERLGYATKPELAEVAKRLEGLIDRNLADRVAASARTDERLTVIERFVVTSQARVSTLQALFAALLSLILLGLTIAGFVLARTGG